MAELRIKRSNFFSLHSRRSRAGYTDRRRWSSTYIRNMHGEKDTPHSDRVRRISGLSSSHQSYNSMAETISAFTTSTPAIFPFIHYRSLDRQKPHYSSIYAIDHLIQPCSEIMHVSPRIGVSKRFTSLQPHGFQPRLSSQGCPPSRKPKAFPPLLHKYGTCKLFMHAL
jgi:hypothetical protein